MLLLDRIKHSLRLGKRKKILLILFSLLLFTGGIFLFYKLKSQVFIIGNRRTSQSNTISDKDKEEGTNEISSKSSSRRRRRTRIECRKQLYDQLKVQHESYDEYMKEIVKYQNYGEENATEMEKLFSNAYKKDAQKSQSGEVEKVYFSGSGSWVEASISVRCLLERIIDEYEIDHMIDVSCGDLGWMRFFLKDHPEIKYTGSDAVNGMIIHHNDKFKSENVEFIYLGDISKKQYWDDFRRKSRLYKKEQKLLVFIRHTLQHNPPENVKQILDNFDKNSHGSYLIATQRHVAEFNFISENIIREGYHNNYNLILPPFGLPGPLECMLEDTLIESECPGFLIHMCLWDLPFKTRFNVRLA